MTEQTVPAETGIDEAMIEQLVHRFYAKIREDSLLGPIFLGQISDWDSHLRAMCDFWSSVVLMSGRYHGQPMPKHQKLPIDATHFDRWLMLFEETLQEFCSQQATDQFISRAQRIAQSLQLGIAVARGIPPGKPGNLISVR